MAHVQTGDFDNVKNPVAMPQENSPDGTYMHEYTVCA